MLKVVGWTDYITHFREAQNDDEEMEALLKEIRDNGYQFAGDDHEDHPHGAPVLSNGKIMRFSWRGWGGVIAMAKDWKGNYDYSLWYMREYAPQKPVYPTSDVNYAEIDTGVVHDVFLAADEEARILKFRNDLYNPEVLENFSVSFYYILPCLEGRELYHGDKVVLHYSDGSAETYTLGQDGVYSYADSVFPSVLENNQFGKLDDLPEFLRTRYPDEEIDRVYILFVDI